jgi:hypothetical protein
MSNPWMKFYPRDWRGDQSLRAVSIAARGLWMECLCIMHEAKPYGHLLLNGEPVEDGTLARMCGAPVDEVSALMAELRQAGVFSVTGKGVVFSRRMTKDHARASKGKKAAQKRWAQDTENAGINSAPNGSPNRKPTTQKPEARKKGANAPSAGASKNVETVEAIWKLLPAKKRKLTSKSKLVRPLAKILKAGHRPEAVIAAVSRCYSEPRHKEDGGQFAPAAYSFLADGVWENYAPQDAVTGPEPDLSTWQNAMRLFVETGQWSSQVYGPKPGEPGCRVPDGLLNYWRKTQEEAA